MYVVYDAPSSQGVSRTNFSPFTSIWPLKISNAGSSAAPVMGSCVPCITTLPPTARPIPVVKLPTVGPNVSIASCPAVTPVTPLVLSCVLIPGLDGLESQWL